MIATITGGAGALGSTLAKLLVTKGYKVALFDTERAQERLSSLVSEIGKDKAVAHAGDFAQAATWTAALEATKGAFGALPTHAALVAGGWAGGKPLHEGDDASYAQMIGSNLDTAYRALRALLPSMVEKKSGSIVVVGSRAAVRPYTSAKSASYAAAKAGVVAMAEAVAQEVLLDNVRINAILPSTMDTTANRKSMPDADPSRWVTLESAAGVIAFLFSEEARDITGAALPVYGRA